jgi:hypothetical protein
MTTSRYGTCIPGVPADDLDAGGRLAADRPPDSGRGAVRRSRPVPR